MNILLNVENAIKVFGEIKFGIENSFLLDLLNTLTAIVTMLLGVVTIILGLNYISKKRQNARFGFYINLFVFIQQFHLIIKEYPEVTDYLVEERIRNVFSNTKVTAQRSEKVLEVFMSLCEDFIKFISTAENNVVPKHSEKSGLTEEEEWEQWYKSISTIVKFSHQCKLLKNGIVPYFSDDQLPIYQKERIALENSIIHLYNELDRILKYNYK